MFFFFKECYFSGEYPYIHISSYINCSPFPTISSFEVKRPSKKTLTITVQLKWGWNRKLWLSKEPQTIQTSKCNSGLSGPGDSVCAPLMSGDSNHWVSQFPHTSGETSQLKIGVTSHLLTGMILQVVRFQKAFQGGHVFSNRAFTVSFWDARWKTASENVTPKGWLDMVDLEPKIGNKNVESSQGWLGVSRNSGTLKSSNLP